MSVPRWILWSGSLVCLVSAPPALRAQYAAPPDAYTVKEVNSMLGVAGAMEIYRDGTKALVDINYPPGGARPNGSHTRTLYDLQAGTNLTWSLMEASMPCSAGRFKGDWGDPFKTSAELNGQLAKLNPKDNGTENIGGISAKVQEAELPNGGKAKLWIEPKYGLMMKVEMSTAEGKTQTLLDVKQVSFAKPDASLFVPPASCSSASAGKLVPTESERIAAETGESASNFVNAIMPPASRNTCTVLLRVVHAGTMAPITSGFQVAVDPTFDPAHRAMYNVGAGADGKATFSGGGLRDMTSQMQNGVLRIDNAPAQFDIETAFGKGGFGSALIYRQCFGPQTVLLYVVKNPDKLSDGTDWLWVKSGKYAKP